MARVTTSTCALLLLYFTILAKCQTSSNDSIRYSSLTDIFPALQSLDIDRPKKQPKPGRQYFPRCCLQAVRESYEIIDGEVFTVAGKFIKLTATELNATQFPCGAKYQDDHAEGAPEVKVPYSWCRNNCNGWQRSSGKALNEWVQPFVGFILPSAVFCLHVPRKFVLAIGEQWFSNDFKFFPNKWKAFVIPLKVLLASLATMFGLFYELDRTTDPLPSVNTTMMRRRSSVAAIGVKSLTIGGQFLKVFATFGALCWFLMVSTSSTAIRATSAASIALLNTIIWVAIVFSTATPMILSGLYEASLDRNIIKDMRASLLLADSWKDKDEDQRRADHVGRMEEDVRLSHYHERVHQLYAVLVGNLILPKVKTTSDKVTARSHSVWDDVNILVQRTRKPASTNTTGHGVHLVEYGESIMQHKEITATPLKGMLGCQVSFGAAVGAPIVFFLGSFLFSVISNYSSLGENNTSHALAFGMWWMTIPHVAIVSGCLLAGNNPNILEVIVIGAVDPKKHDKSLKRLGSGRWYQPFYDTAYTPVWMIERGRNKQQWIDRIVDLYPSRASTHDSHRRKRAFHLEWTDWLEIVIIAIILVVFPFVLALLTSYNTPRVGLACRSLTFMLYFILQICYSLLWLWDFFYPHHVHSHPDQEKRSKHLDRLYFVLLTLVLLGSGFTAVVGTLLQIIGVYRNCLCAMPVQHWLRKDSFIVLSGNSATAIRLARTFWLPTGVASIVLLVITCYGGWWYQRHWREEFREVVDMLCRPGLAFEGRSNVSPSVVVDTVDPTMSGANGGKSETSRGRKNDDTTGGVKDVSDGISSLTPSPGGSRGRSIARKPLPESGSRLPGNRIP